MDISKAKIAGMGEGGGGKGRGRERSPVTSFSSVCIMRLHLDLGACQEQAQTLTSRQGRKGSHFGASTGAKFT